MVRNPQKELQMAVQEDSPAVMWLVLGLFEVCIFGRYMTGRKNKSGTPKCLIGKLDPQPLFRKQRAES